MTDIKKPPVYRIALVQAGVLLSLCLCLSLFCQDAVVSALLGGLLCLVPQTYFTLYAFQHTGARSAGLVARGFYRGEVGKFVLTLVGFAIVFSRFDTQPGVLFGSYGLLLLVQWIVSARVIGAFRQGEQ